MVVSHEQPLVRARRQRVNSVRSEPVCGTAGQDSRSRSFLPGNKRRTLAAPVVYIGVIQRDVCRSSLRLQERFVQMPERRLPVVARCE